MHRHSITITAVAVVAVAATATVAPGPAMAVDSNVAIEDPVNGRKARVDGSRRQHVFDERGTADKLQSRFVRFWQDGPSTCSVIATPPAGRSLVVKSLFVNTYTNPSPGFGQYVSFYVGANCTGLAATVNPGGIGTTAVPLEPGLIVPAGQFLWARENGDIEVELYGTGYTVQYNWAPNAVSVSAQTEAVSAQSVEEETLGNRSPRMGQE